MTRDGDSDSAGRAGTSAGRGRTSSWSTATDSDLLSLLVASETATGPMNFKFKLQFNAT